MAAATTQQLNYDEELVNRWTFDFYVSKALDAFRNADYSSFAQFGNLIQALVVRPIDGQSDMTIKLRIMQFLLRINDGDKLDCVFQDNLIPLESALKILEHICSEINVLQNDLEKVHTSVREMIVIACIKKGNFEKAEEMMLKYFPKNTASAGKQKLFEDLIKRRCSTHSVLQSVPYREFKQDMLDFIEKVYRIPEPFLNKIKVAKQDRAIDIAVSRKPPAVHEQSSTQHRTMQNGQLPRERTVVENHSLLTSEQNTPAQNIYSALPPLSLRQLMAAFIDLAGFFSVLTSFSQLQTEVEEEAAEQESGIDLDQDELHLRLSETQSEGPREPEERGHMPEEKDTAADSVMQSKGAKHVPKQQSDVSMLEPSGSHSGSVSASRQVREEKSATRETVNAQAPAFSHEDVEKRPGPAVSAVTVAQLVMEEDSQSSEPEADDSQKTPSSLQAGSSEENPLSSLSTTSTPVRKICRSAAKRKNIPTKTVSPKQPTEPQNCSTPARGASIRLSSPKSTPKDGHKSTMKRSHQILDSASEESMVVDSPPSAKQPVSTFRGLMDRPGFSEDWSDEESLFAASTVNKGKGQGKRKMWTDEESEWVKEGVTRYGVGRWEKIKSSFPFKGRTAVQIKDRWRTMNKLNLI